MVRDIEEFEEGIIFIELPDNNVKAIIKIDGIDISSDIQNATIKRTTVNSLSICDFTLDNNLGKHNNKWRGGETVTAFIDYGDGSTQEYTGKLDNARPGMTASGWTMRITSRAYPELVRMRFIGTFTEDNGDSTLKAVIDNLNSRAIGGDVITYTDTSIQETSKTITEDFREIPYIEVFKRINAILGYDSYIDENGVFYAFPEGSKFNKNAIIMSGINVWSCPEFGKDNRTIVNRQRIYGQEKEGCLIGWMEEDKDSQALIGISENPINDTSIVTREQAIERAKAEISEKATEENKGTVSCIGMTGLIPGYKIDSFITYVLDGKFIVKEYTHTYSSGSWDTIITLSEREVTAISIIKEREREVRFINTFQNPNSMDNWYHFTFDDDSQISSNANTETTNGKLRLITETADSGTMTSIQFTLPYSPSAIEVRFNGNEDNDLGSFDVSIDGGSNYEEDLGVRNDGEPGDIRSVTNAGDVLIIRVNMRSNTENPQPQIESLSVGLKP